MGGCVSGPKDVALNEGEEAPAVETPITPTNAEGQTVVAQEEGEKKEEALVDPNEAKEEKVEEAKAEVVAAKTKEPEKEEAKVEAEQPKAEEKSEETLVTL